MEKEEKKSKEQKQIKFDTSFILESKIKFDNKPKLLLAGVTEFAILSNEKLNKTVILLGENHIVRNECEKFKKLAKKIITPIDFITKIKETSDKKKITTDFYLEMEKKTYYQKIFKQEVIERKTTPYLVKIRDSGLFSNLRSFNFRVHWTDARYGDEIALVTKKFFDLLTQGIAKGLKIKQDYEFKHNVEYLIYTKTVLKDVNKKISVYIIHGLIDICKYYLLITYVKHNEHTKKYIKFVVTSIIKKIKFVGEKNNIINIINKQIERDNKCITELDKEELEKFISLASDLIYYNISKDFYEMIEKSSNLNRIKNIFTKIMNLNKKSFDKNSNLSFLEFLRIALKREVRLNEAKGIVDFIRKMISIVRVKMFGAFSDIYTFLRMNKILKKRNIKKINNNPINNIIFYGGKSHSRKILMFMVNAGYKIAFLKDADSIDNCVDLTKLEKYLQFYNII